MRQPFCILVVLGDLLDDGELRLIDTACTLADARRRIEEFAQRLPGQYVIYDRDTGQRVSVFAPFRVPDFGTIQTTAQT